MFDDFKDLLSAFNAHGVKYLIVGGYAVSFHAQPRATKGLDLFIKADPAHARAVYAALMTFARLSPKFQNPNLQIRGSSSALGMRRLRWTYCRESMVLNSMTRGKGVWTPLSTEDPV